MKHWIFSQLNKSALFLIFQLSQNLFLFLSLLIFIIWDSSMNWMMRIKNELHSMISIFLYTVSTVKFNWMSLYLFHHTISLLSVNCWNFNYIHTESQRSCCSQSSLSVCTIYLILIFIFSFLFLLVFHSTIEETMWASTSVSFFIVQTISFINYHAFSPSLLMASLYEVLMLRILSLFHQQLCCTEY